VLAMLAIGLLVYPQAASWVARIGHNSEISGYVDRVAQTPDAERQAILDGLKACGLPVWSPLLERPGADGRPDVLAGIEQFREHLGGRLCVTLPRSIGDKVEVHRISVPLMMKAIGLLRPAERG